MVRKRWNNLNMATKLTIVFSMVSVIPLVICSFVLYYTSVTSLEAVTEEMAAVFSSQIASDMNRFIGDYDALTKSLLVNDELIEKLDTALPIMERIENQQFFREAVMKMATVQSEIQGVTILNEEGEYYQYDRNGRSISYDTLMHQEWMEEEKKRNGDVLFLTPLHDCSYYDRDSDRILITFGRRVYGANGRYKGMILIDLEPSSLIKLSDEFLLERNQYNIKINITTRDGGLIYDSDLSSGRIAYSEINEEKLLMYQKDPHSYVIIENATKQLGLRVNTVIPRSRMYLRISTVQRVTLVLVGILFGITMLISSTFSRQMMYLVRRLQSGMKRLESGSYELITDEVGTDEMGSLVTSYNHMVGKMKALLEEVYQAGVRQKNAQFLALRTQINPHFLFNTLESIRIKAILNGDDEVADMIKILARLFRTTLDSDRQNHTVEDELENIRSYIQLQNIRFDNVITLTEQIDTRLRSAKIMSVLFQPVVENCFKYGSRESNVPIRITITGRVTEDKQMCFTIRDDGQGMSPERLEEIRRRLEQPLISLQEKDTDRSRSIGLQNIAERLHLRYGEKGSIRIVSSDASGTNVEICVPYQE